MKRAAISIRALVVRLVAGVGLEGGFLLVGTALLAVGSSFISAIGPWIVTGIMCILAGIALAIPERRK